MMTRKPLQRSRPMSRGATTLQRSSFKRSTPKKRQGHDKTMRDACRGEPCYLAIPGICRGAIDSVVPCHANWAEYGKGMGIKAADRFTVPGCLACHHWLDQGSAPRADKKNAWEAAYQAWDAVRANKINQKTNPASARTDPGHVIASTKDLQ